MQSQTNPHRHRRAACDASRPGSARWCAPRQGSWPRPCAALPPQQHPPPLASRHPQAPAVWGQTQLSRRLQCFLSCCRRPPRPATGTHSLPGPPTRCRASAQQPAAAMPARPQSYLAADRQVRGHRRPCRTCRSIQMGPCRQPKLRQDWPARSRRMCVIKIDDMQPRGACSKAERGVRTTAL